MDTYDSVMERFPSTDMNTFATPLYFHGVFISSKDFLTISSQSPATEQIYLKLCFFPYKNNPLSATIRFSFYSALSVSYFFCFMLLNISIPPVISEYQTCPWLETKLMNYKYTCGQFPTEFHRQCFKSNKEC